MAIDWRRELRNQRILEMWRQNRTSSEIAKFFGVTRGVVMGVVGRYGEKKNIKKPSVKIELPEIVNVPKPKKAARKRTRSKLTKPEKQIDLSLPFKEMTYVKTKGKKFMQLSPFDCRWVFDDKSYCAQPKMYKSYCEYHARIVYIPIVKKEKPRRGEP